MMKRNLLTLSIAATLGLSMSALVSTSLMAQEQPEADDDLMLEEVIVTGSAIRRDDLENTLPIQIITEVDIMTQLTEMMSMQHPGVRVTMHMPLIPKEGKSGLHALVSAIVQQGWGIMGIGGVKTPRKEDTWEAVVKIPNVTVDDVVAALSDIEDQEIVDVREL